jgi:hypothetical protein
MVIIDSPNNVHFYIFAGDMHSGVVLNVTLKGDYYNFFMSWIFMLLKSDNYCFFMHMLQKMIKW